MVQMSFKPSFDLENSKIVYEVLFPEEQDCLLEHTVKMLDYVFCHVVENAKIN